MKSKSKIRGIVQILFFVLVALIAVNHSLVEAGYAIPFIGSFSLHAVCPFGSVVSIYQLITTGTFIKKIHEASMVLLYIVIFLSILFGPVFCGWLCPLGTIQEWIHKLSKKLGIKKIEIPQKIDRYLRYIRYIILFLIIMNTAKSGILMFENLDPYYALFNFWTPDFAIKSGIILIIVLVANLFIERAWCKYACPFGALLGITNLFKVFKIKREPSTCISCNLCSKACPMNIDVAGKEVIKDHQCISCLECTSDISCPVGDTVVFKSTIANKRLKSKALGLIIILSIISGVLYSMTSGYWRTESSKIPIKLESGDYDPSDIRGSYSFADIESTFNVPLDVLQEAFMIPDSYDIAAFKNKDLEGIYVFDDDTEIGNGSVKMFVSLYTGLPYDFEAEGDYLPLSAYNLLATRNLIPSDKDAIIQALLIDLDEVKSLNTTENIAAVEINPEEHSEEVKVNGSTTFSQLLAWGISTDEISGVLGHEILATNLVIKDYCNEQSISFSELKTELQILLDLIKQ